ncbi:unnamed protein product [Ranitomeya imitator]|uniref:Angiotensin-converting enzyme n=1 Tax=Ranitomeya imitator TaxID=111125 RepID=A0ABN9M6G7_9NEOB|nr:unnamed protein product [Ranitomeya imitator]
MTNRQHQKRLTRAKERKNWTVAQWSKVLFSDESKFYNSFGNQGPRIWRKSGETNNPSCWRSSVKFPQSVMVWGAMSSAGVRFIKTKVSAAVYQEILEHFMLPSADKLFGDENCILQQDWTPIHTAKSTNTWFTNNSITVLDWPANSPDLNPIDNLWSIVKRKMRDTRPNNADELKAAIKATSASITPQQHHRLIASMPRRIDAVIDAKGPLHQNAQNNVIIHLIFQNAASEKWSKFYSNASDFSTKYPVNEVTDNMVKLQLIHLGNKGSGVLPTDKYTRLNAILNEMSTIYSTQTVCSPDGSSCLPFEPGLDRIMLESQNYHERLWVWEGWRAEAGKRMRKLYEEYVDLENEAARLNGYEDYGDYWRGNYETLTDDTKYQYSRGDLMNDVEETFKQIVPLYEELHAYVRSKLQKHYGAEYIASGGSLPAHLLGDMWGRFWTNLYPLVVPYPDRESIDVTNTMVDQGWTVEKMFKEAEKFFMSVDLFALNPNFWNNSMLVEPSDGRKVVCHPTAWDLGMNDFRYQALRLINNNY